MLYTHLSIISSNLKEALTFGFRVYWLVNPARASPSNFSPSCTGSQRPVISFLDQPIIHVTFGIVEYSNLINPSSGSGKRFLHDGHFWLTICIFQYVLFSKVWHIRDPLWFNASAGDKL